MIPVLPHKIAAIVRKDGLSEQTMRAWMESVTESLSLLDVVEGVGSPEGVLFAKKHKEYFDTAGSPGSYYYRKTTDETFNTGWVAIG